MIRCQHVLTPAGLPLVLILLATIYASTTKVSLRADEPKQLFKQYCLDCHEGPSAEANLDLAALLKTNPPNPTLIFENVVTAKMPPLDADQPSDEQRRKMLAWLADQQPESKPTAFRRTSRHEFVHKSIGRQRVVEHFIGHGEVAAKYLAT